MTLLANSLRVKAALLCASAFLAAAMVSSPALAQRARGDDDQKAPPSFSEATGKVMNQAIEYMNMGDYADAVATINKLRIDRLSPYEHSRVEQILFGIAVQQEKYDEARKHLKEAIAAGGLSAQEVDKANFTIAQLYITEEDYKNGIATLENWFKTAMNPNSAAYYLLAAAYYQYGTATKNKALTAKALAPAKKAVELAGDSPKTSWLELLYALYVDREDYKQAIPVTERLVELEPKKKDYWLRLSSMYQQTDQIDKAFAAIQIAYNAGLFTQDSEYRRLANMSVYTGVPDRCARILRSAIKDKTVKADSKAYETLANCLVNAREFDKSLEPLERAAKLSDDGELYVRLGEVQIQREDWSAAAEAIQNGIDKGKLKDPHNAELWMGIALYNGSKPRDARRWFVRAEKSKEHRKTAQAYVQRIDAEAKQRAQAQTG